MVGSYGTSKQGQGVLVRVALGLATKMADTQVEYKRVELRSTQRCVF